MTLENSSRLDVPKSYFFHGQLAHVLGLAVLILAAVFLLDWSRLADVAFLRLPGIIWAISALAIGPLHQLLVWFFWRSEMIYGNIKPLFDGRGFAVYTALFMVFLLGRPLLLIGLGLADFGSLDLHWTIPWLIAPLIAVPVAYTMFSVGRYFGLKRAVGGDHFFEKYRQGFVRGGIFKYVNNSMYALGMLILILIGIWTFSRAAVIVGAFHYLAIWLHYVCTEKPDFIYLYGEN